MYMHFCASHNAIRQPGNPRAWQFGGDVPFDVSWHTLEKGAVFYSNECLNRSIINEVSLDGFLLLFMSFSLQVQPSKDESFFLLILPCGSFAWNVKFLKFIAERNLLCYSTFNSSSLKGSACAKPVLFPSP